MYENAYQNAILGLSVALIVGTAATTIAVYLMHKWADSKETDEGVPADKRTEKMSLRIHLLAGLLERLVFVLLIVANVSAAGAFIGTWVLAKIATGWNRYTDSAIHFRRRAYIGLIGSLISVFFALFGAILWDPDMLP